MYRFLFSSKWLGYLLVAVLFAIACLGLGLWQMARKAEVDAAAHKVANNYSAAPLNYQQAKGQFENLDLAKEWTPVSLTGVYDLDGQRIVRNRPLNGQPGYEVVIPLKLSNGDAVVIDRGWLPIGDKDPGRPDSIPAPPSGTVTVLARLRPGEVKLQRGAPEGQLASIELKDYAQQLNYPLLTGAYAAMYQESPAATVTPAALSVPAFDNGTNFSYALQWFAFGVLFLVGYGYVVRQQVKMDRLEIDEETSAAQQLGRSSAFQTARKSAPKTSRKRSAEDEEDAILDAQGFTGGLPAHQETARD
ncbi:SURF1 family protein [Psychromicrobium lacuslunae]|uniref:SURF1-like protein n=1 Tax=Psychromicrobium lacuslunae TaxID=1618207 RepID=A0A0D4BX36_9MICC|nr:SURF1 family protein [Psychromicrobium lacuslunae]AJT40889.1 cytochrome oxidase biogenesis protein Surf1, facilitates heme A insertion [Psychromicrobium lacuslunae]